MEAKITLKELYERLVILETKVDAQGNVNKITAKRFTAFAWIVILFEIVNFALNVVLIYANRI